jgi:hypothetical protein
MDALLRALDRSKHSRKGILPIDDDLDRVALAHRRA